MEKIGILGAGAMGSGIAQVAAAQGHDVVLCDKYPEAIAKSRENLNKTLQKLVDKEKLNAEDAHALQGRIRYADQIDAFRGCTLVIEAIVEALDPKQAAFREIEAAVSPDAIIATNTSSLSVSAIAACLQKPERAIGIHFFNPAPLMRLVEIIPALQTAPETTALARQQIAGWGKTTVLAKDTPGFIVNRVARPFYGEALRILEEGIADAATIDWAMREHGGFRMGPFELMDFIGNDVNYAVTESVFRAFYFDPRYKPAFTQKRLVDAQYLGRKTGRGYYEYRPGSVPPEPQKDSKLAKEILNRVLAMLINEAADALYLNIASRDDLELAMTQGVNYPKGLLAWADELGIKTIVDQLDALYSEYHEDRYRSSRLLRVMAREGQLFF